MGPFDFSQVRLPMQGRKRRAVSEHNRVDDVYWKLLSERSPQFGVDVSDIRSKPVGESRTSLGQV